jgi:hypothetical protein
MSESSLDPAEVGELMIPLHEKKRPTSFLNHLEETHHRETSILRNRRVNSFSSLLPSSAALSLLVDNPSSLPQQPSNFSAAEQHPEYQASSSQNGFLQWISACGVSRLFLLMMFVLYGCYQAGRTYFAIWATWWNFGFFSLSITTYHWVFLFLLVAQIVFRVN